MVAIEISASELRRIKERSPSTLHLLKHRINHHQIDGDSLEECLAKLDMKKLKDRVFEIAERKGANLVYFDDSLTVSFVYDSHDKEKFRGIMYPIGYTLYRS
ncbi:hypothetical protein J4417_02480 [Candidatus Woesearchaeota archaeon]|nr:hypothetical protein [Candidatus Woesearchaeota archaeon]